MEHFADSLMAAIRRAGNPVCVGIDPRPEDLPPELLDKYSEDRAGVARAVLDFGRAVVEVVAPLVSAVKFQAAYFEAYGPEGVQALHATASHARRLGLVVLIDGKRNDIGSTAEAYARAYLGKVPVGDRFEPSWDVDALTVNPYFGTDGIAPFVKVAAREGKGIFVLVRTSNPSASEFQDLVADGRPIYLHVAERLKAWASPHLGKSGYSLVGAVVGATYPDELIELRRALPGVPFLIPGYGAQGGTAADIAPAFDADGLGALISSSRGITLAFKKPAAIAKFRDDWKGAIAQAVRDMIDDLASNS